MELFEIALITFLIYYGYQGRIGRKRNEWKKITFSDISLIVGLLSLIAVVFGGN